MAVSRRNTLIGLGALVGGAGVFAATGAFTTVEAQRTIDIEAAGDASALLQIRPANSSNESGDAQIVDDGDETISFNADLLNLRARTTFSPELVIQNDGSNTVNIDILDDFDGNSLIGTGGVIDFTVNSGDSTNSNDPENQDLGPGDTVVFDISIDFTDSTVDSLSGWDVNSDGPINQTSQVDPLMDEVLAEDFIVIEADEA